MYKGNKMKKQDGMTPETAFVINDSTGEFTLTIGSHLDRLFGSSYFVHSETTLDNKKNNKRYKVLYVEDDKGHKHSIFFEI
jgi:hypothetical protein